MNFFVVIPARYGSSRLPAKPLALIHGKPMVLHVAERALQSDASEVVVATDHAEIASIVTHTNHPRLSAVLTDPHHVSGTDRVAEVAQKKNWLQEEIIINLQGDEPGMSAHIINAVADAFQQKPNCLFSTAAHELRDEALIQSSDCVKVVLSRDQRAIYFSRSAIPYLRSAEALQRTQLPYYRHLGIYGFRGHFLQTFRQLTASALEQVESLEQLRALWHGYDLHVALTVAPDSDAVDTAEDLARVSAQLASLTAT